MKGNIAESHNNSQYCDKNSVKVLGTKSKELNNYGVSSVKCLNIWQIL